MQKLTPVEFVKRLLAITEIAVQHSGGRLCLAQNERDSPTTRTRAGASFLKLDGQRHSQDIEFYAFVSKRQGQDACLVLFLEEIVFPLKKAGLIDSYRAVTEQTKELGRHVFVGEALDKWCEMLDMWCAGV